VLFRKPQNYVANRYIRERIRLARSEANETQEDLARVLEKNRVAISDMERGRVSVSAADLNLIAAHFRKPISFFYPPRVTINRDELSSLDEELVSLFHQLPESQQYITLEYVKQQADIALKSFHRKLADDAAISKNENRES
jgi:transcriptional regulator with XRE-family HTH domain